MILVATWWSPHLFGGSPTATELRHQVIEGLVALGGEHQTRAGQVQAMQKATLMRLIKQDWKLPKRTKELLHIGRKLQSLGMPVAGWDILGQPVSFAKVDGGGQLIEGTYLTASGCHRFFHPKGII